ncbi:hypothetical protein [Raoultella ornithinolytica]|uniref:hypothetical protein n=1 Tax=Raoultella ornithinolytica TaxID=54291 RepID=UPI001BD48E39|nr:hypothetical protein [Raoultella ornithinolytica]
MYKTAQQLIREAHEAANGLPPASASILKEVASRLDVSTAALIQVCDERSTAINTITATRVNSGCPEGVDVQDWVKQLVAENVGLKAAIRAVNRTAEECEVNGDELKYVVEPTEFEALTDLLDESHATSADLSGIKAGPLVSALKVIANSEQHNGDMVVCDFDTLISVAACALRDYYAQQLREVSANG